MKIGIIGLGLIGASLAEVLTNLGHEVVGVSKTQLTIKKALEKNIIKNGSIELEELQNCEIVFICTPINKVLFYINKLRQFLPQETIITDVASIKGPIIDFVDTDHEPINFIGGHPMAGTENKGIDFAFSELFNGCKWVLTPSKWTKQEDLDKLSLIIKKIGANVILANAQEHDKAVSIISHMPVIITQALVKLLKDYPDKNISELALKLAASGFRDTTRIAATNPELVKDMLVENKSNVLTSLKEFFEYTHMLENMLINDEEKFIEESIDIAKLRCELYSSNGKNSYS